MKVVKVEGKLGNVFFCNFCEYTTSRSDNYKTHLLTAKHLKMVKSGREKKHKYYCDFCDYNASRKDHYTKHTMTAKHLK